MSMEKTQMAQKLPRLYKVERYQFEFALANSETEAKRFVLSDAGFSGPLVITSIEIQEMDPSEEGYHWNPYDVEAEDWIGFSCGEWLEQTAEARRQEKEKASLRETAMAKLTLEEQAAILEWAVGSK